MFMRSARRFVPFVFFLFLGSVVFPGAAGGRVIFVPDGLPTLELAAGVATVEDTVIVTDPALREEAARFGRLFRVVFVPAAKSPAAAGPGVSGPSKAPCLAEWIEGKVVDAVGSPLPSIRVRTWPVGPGIGDTAQTDLFGNYIVCAEAGDYAVTFNESPVNDYLPEVYNDKSFGCGDIVTVPPSGNPVVNASLVRGGFISGRVTDGVLPLAGVSVIAMSKYWTRLATTDATGNYRINGLRSGEYTVRFTHDTRGYEFYDGQGMYADARPVSVTAGRTTTGIDAALPPGATLSGTVDDGSLPLPSVQVGINSADGGGYNALTGTDPSGNYSFPGLREGRYIVYFQSDSGQPQWYDGKTGVASADPVQVSPPLNVSGIDVTIKPAGSIQGVVTDGGAGVPGILVGAFSQKRAMPYYTATLADGSYLITGLMDGPYRVHASGTFDGYESEWYSGAANPGEAQVITIAGDSSATGVDFDISPVGGGTMSGRISYEGGQCSGVNSPAVWILPDAPLNQYQMGGPIIAPAGVWKSHTLAAGNYRVRVTNPGGHHQEQWYPGVPAFNRSRVVTVSPGADRGGVDVKLPRDDDLPVPEVFFRTPSYFIDYLFNDVLSMGPGDKHPMSLDLACNGARGVPVDYWLLAFTPLPPPLNVYHFEPGRGWQPGLEVSVQGPCANQDGLKVTDVPYFPLGGDVDIYFGVDGVVNGTIDPGSLFYDGMRVHMYK